MGLRFHHVPNGVFDSGGTGTNAVEARTVAEAIIRHAKTHPGQSLGVATFSVSQRRAIQDELEASPTAQSRYRGLLPCPSERAVLRQEPRKRAGRRARRDLDLGRLRRRMPKAIWPCASARSGPKAASAASTS